MAKTEDYTVKAPDGSVRVKQLSAEDAARLEKFGYEIEKGRNLESMTKRAARTEDKARRGVEDKSRSKDNDDK